MMAAVVVSASLLFPHREASAALVEIVASSPGESNATNATNETGASVPVEQGSIPDRALRQAVLQAANDILPAPIEDARRVMLDRMLAKRAQGFVISYAEQESRTENDAVVRVFDVQVNRRSLKQWLRQLGLFATAHFDLGYSRSIQGATAEQIQSIDQLAMLMGLDLRAGVTPAITISREGESWKGSLQADSGTLSRTSESLSSVWLALWGEYFAGRYEQDSLLAAAASNGLKEETMANARGTLTVRGWTSLDAVGSFDVHLKSWPAEAQDVAFGDMHFGASSIAATWSLTAKQPNALKERIDEYIAGKDLKYTLSLEAPASPAAGNATEATEAETVVIEGASEEVSDQLDEALKNAEQEASRQTMQEETPGLDSLVDSLAESITSKASNGTGSNGSAATESQSAPSPGGDMPVRNQGDAQGYGPKWRDNPESGGQEPLH